MGGDVEGSDTSSPCTCGAERRLRGGRSLLSPSWAHALLSLAKPRALLGMARPLHDLGLNKDSTSDPWIFL